MMGKGTPPLYLTSMGESWACSELAEGMGVAAGAKPDEDQFEGISLDVPKFLLLH